MIKTIKIKYAMLLITTFSLLTLSYPLSALATGFNYSVKGSALSDSYYDTVNLKGFIRFGHLNVETNHIEDLVSKNVDSITLTYDIIDSNITNESNDVFSTGSGKLFINLLKIGENNWDNYSTWKCGNIQDSLCEGDVYFENKQLLNILDYDVLPSTMYLNYGIVFNEYSFIDLTLTLDTVDTQTQVPEPSTMIFALIGMTLFFKKTNKIIASENTN